MTRSMGEVSRVLGTDAVVPLLSPASVAAFHADGHVTTSVLLSVKEIYDMRSALARLFSRLAGAERGDFLDLVGTDDDPTRAALPQILMPGRYAPELLGLRIHAVVRRLAAQLLGDDVAAEGEHTVLKPCGGPKTPLHQDEAFWGEATDYQSISIWIPLQDVSAENGCLHFVTGSHLRGVVTHHSLNNDARNNGIEVDGVEKFETVPCHLPAGAASIHHCRTLHGAGPNTSSEPRYAYVFGFGLPPRPATEPRDYHWLRAKNLERELRARAHGLELTKMRREY